MQEVVDDRELVGDLRAAEDDGVRPLGVLGEALEHVDLGGDEAAHRGRQPGRDVVDRRLLAVHDPEAVGDEGVGEAGEGVGELGALLVGLGGLARVEPQVLEQHDVAVGHARRPRPARSRPPCRWRRSTGRPRSSASRPTTGAERVLLLGSALGPAEVGAHDDACARLGELRDGRDRRPDAAVVRDRRAVERHVEVGPDEDALAAQVAQRGDVSHGRLGPGRSEALADEDDEVDEAVGVAPLVVVPADDLDLVADDLGQARVEDARAPGR